MSIDQFTVFAYRNTSKFCAVGSLSADLRELLVQAVGSIGSPVRQPTKKQPLKRLPVAVMRCKTFLCAPGPVRGSGSYPDSPLREIMVLK